VAHLVDTSILGRLANAGDALHLVAASAVVELHRRGEVLQITAQNLVEFRNVATRPKAANGLGLSAVEAEAQAAAFEPPSRFWWRRRTFSQPGRPWWQQWVSSASRFTTLGWWRSVTFTV
jgi:hypothetical protein